MIAQIAQAEFTRRRAAVAKALAAPADRGGIDDATAQAMLRPWAALARWSASQAGLPDPFSALSRWHEPRDLQWTDFEVSAADIGLELYRAHWAAIIRAERDDRPETHTRAANLRALQQAWGHQPDPASDAAIAITNNFMAQLARAKATPERMAA